MKIHLHSSVFAPSIGGVETVGLMLAEEWTRLGMEVRVTTETPDSEEKFNFPIIRRPSRKVLWKTTRWADVVFHNHPCTRLAWAPILCRKPWLAIVHTWLPMFQPAASLRKSIQAKVQRHLVSRCQLLGVSEAIASHIPNRCVPVVPNPCRFQVAKTVEASERPIDLLFVGRLVSDKGIDLLIEALALLAREKQFLKTKIIGDGPLHASLQRKVTACGLGACIEFVGSLTGEAVREAYASARYTVVPSRWEEPFGLVAIETLACGSLPIVADSGGLPEAVGPHGIIFPAGDVEALAKELRRIWADQASPAVSDPLKVAKWLERHDPAKVASRYLDLFQEAL